MINIKATDKTPDLQFDSERGTISIEGRSIAENPVEFYRPLFEKIKSYAQNPVQQTTLRVKLEYFNTPSSKVLLDLFNQLNKLSDKSEVLVKWCYEKEDADMLEIGQDYESIVPLKFEMIEV